MDADGASLPLRHWEGCERLTPSNRATSAPLPSVSMRNPARTADWGSAPGSTLADPDSTVVAADCFWLEAETKRPDREERDTVLAFLAC